MSREFAITTPSPSVSLDSKGRGEVSFTVSNVASFSMRARASVMPSGDLKPEWLTVREPNERPMSPGSTETFLVDIQVPPKATAGTYTFRLVVADVELPDERFAEGPAVAMQVAPPPPKAAFPWWWVVLGALVLIGGATAAFFLLRGEKTPPPPPPPTCPSGETDCGGQCVVLSRDLQNCGACGNACGPDQVCVGGSCQCDEGLTRCGGTCVNLQSNDDHCGRCGNVCAENFDCASGQCVRTGCPGGQTLCSGQCVNTETDTRNCGRCGVTCASGLTCSNGRCTCSGSLTLCSGRCVNTSTDERNCGRCGSVCASGRECRSGQCISVFPGCPTGTIFCDCTESCLTPQKCDDICRDRLPR